jgi:hypothetical protein
MNSTNSFYAKPSDTKNKFALGAFFIIIGFLFQFTTGRSFLFIPLGILQIFFANWQKKPIIKVHNDHFEMKITPIAPKHLILFSDIKEIIEVNEKKALLKTKDKEISVPLKILTIPDGKKLLDLLQLKLV